MADFPHTYCSKFGNNEGRDEEEEDIYQGETNIEPDNQQHHECMIHEQHLQLTQVEEEQLPEEETFQRCFSETSKQETQLGDILAPVTQLDNEGEHTEQYMLDVSGNISENLSFYLDGKIVSTSTVSSCEVAEVHAGSSGVVGLDALILDPTHITQVLNPDSVSGKEIPGQLLAKRRTTTPPLLPQIKTELESEVVVSSSSSTLVSSLIENLLPLNTESTVTQKERTVFLSPKLKQILEKQDGLKPTLALITDGQTPCSPVSLSVLPTGTGKFKRRTGSPSSSPQNLTSEEMPTPDTGNFVAVIEGHMETENMSPVQLTASEKDDPKATVEMPVEKPVLTEHWPPMTGGNSCNQQPLDLSNTVKRNSDLALADAVLDLSLQKKSLDESELTLNLFSQAVLKEGPSNKCMVDKPLINVGEQNVSLGNPETLLTDFTIVTGPDIMTPVEPVADGLVYGLALPPNSLTPSSASLTPVTLQSAAPCTIAFASSAPHTMLSSTPSLITVLAPTPPITNPSSQPIQVLSSNITPENLVICTDNALTSSECDLAAAFVTANSSNLVTLSQPLDSALNLPSHVFLTDQIALNPPIGESSAMSEVPFTPAVNLNDSLINSYNITSNTVLIECTIALETPGSVVPSATPLQGNTFDAPLPTQMVVNHIEQQQIVSVPNTEIVDPTILVSSISESVTLSTATSVVSGCPPVTELSPSPVVNAEPPTIKEEEPTDYAVSKPEMPCKTPPLSEKAEEDKSSNDALSDEQQSFAKNFICNVCDKLFHSMKELGHHVGDHAARWPYKCEFCVLLFGKPSALLEHRSALHGVGKTYVCSICTKEFVYLCNLKQHQEELHPGQQCTYTEEEKGKLRPQNYNNSPKVLEEPSVPLVLEEPKKPVKKEESEVNVAAEELFTTIKIMASDGGNIKGPNVRLGINQHYPSFKPPPFPYHNRSPAGSMASATNFTTHNIPQTFSTAIRCTKCGKSFDNMPELHKHILACANASDKRRYTPKKNPIPLRHFAKTQNGVLSTTNSTIGLNASNRASQSNRSKPNPDSAVKMKFKVLNKRKKRLVQRVMPQRHKSVSSSNKSSSTQVGEQHEIFVCPHCSREFTMRRCRTKHMAVCPKKSKEVKKRREGGISVTKENDRHLHSGITCVEEKRQQASPQHKTRFQTSGLTKRPAILPVQTVFSNKRSKIVIKESMQPKQETPTLNELPLVRTFKPSMRQYSRVQNSVKGFPLKITIVKPQQTAPQKEELLPTQSQEDAAGDITSNSDQRGTT
ncbi:PR domain zinc finger protein 2-like isoform X1 [Solea solea]|uniref:PR domain zinc finger protein 2-like isoform X1 n=1 Tax=Solea solea TaxID=90069 RepID=UPI00272A6347|nr:PR domain zinc finger protein 2-like isoform X1 [Solea solea]XP_058499477.1 PR domain zinc finger protein 2-like isoform X1 [Solea solea]XP_058499478.1 PR domain zinc finger protein 2-like isoform X1 [Solea solea]XP_058499479.1 PR domain zinc finger protein 2-like isoform X1 [Solea solea]XP_058499480.1 PR domain zinc finger protein 2-like isoform X1 [Solea solea]XP_058499481.1 PR domain zinc finger protein 2-like isoform X1 [Solea solea]